MNAFKFPKPSQIESPEPTPHVKVMRDGREICDAEEYNRRKIAKWHQQNKRCARLNCQRYIPDPLKAENHHIKGRGMGGGKRDDRPEFNELLCVKCHRKEHHQLWS